VLSNTFEFLLCPFLEYCSSISCLYNTNLFHIEYLLPFRTLNLIHSRRPIIIMDRLVCAPLRRVISISPQINPQTLPLTDQPRTQIRSTNTTHTPLHRISTERKRAICILRCAECQSQFGGGGIGRRLHVGVKECGGCDKFYELPGDDLELSGSFVRGHKRGARGCGGGCLKVGVEIGRFNGTDPIVSRLESGSGV